MNRFRYHLGSFVVYKMAAVDAAVSGFCWKYGLPVCFVAITLKLLKPKFSTLYKIGYAYVVDLICIRFNRKLGWRKQRLFANIERFCERKDPTILEIGAGSGSNFEYYPNGANLMCVDPNPYFESYLQSKQINFKQINYQFFVGYGEDMPSIPSNSVDVVACTFVLCSVKDVERCLQEILRVLRPVRVYF